MKKLKYLLFLLVFITATSAFSQQKKVTLSLDKVTVKAALEALKSQSGLSYWFDASDVDVQKVVSVKIKSKSVDEALKVILQGQNVRFEVKNDHVVITKSAQPIPKTSYAPAFGEPRKVSGKVTDVKGEAVIGASILVKGSSTGTISDVNGSYTISVSEKNATLVVSYVGYEKQEVKVTSQQTNIVLVESSKTLDEVVVVGYGTMAKKNVVGAIDKISAQAIEDRPVGNLTQALQGVSSSIVIQQKDFNPNSDDLNINIRGVSTLSSNEPLIVVDGLVVDASTLNTLNPSDIDNVSVLKDAGSAAIYGSRSANGVILVTTKKGKKNEVPKITLNASAGYQDPHILFHPVKGYENAILRNQAAVNVGSSPIYTPSEIRDLYNHGDSEWVLDQILKPALQQTYNASISGGSANSTYMVSAGYYNQKSNFIGPDYGVKRYNFRTNLSTEYKRLKLTGLLSYARTEGKDHASTTSFLLVDSYRIPVYYNYKMKTADGRYLVNDVLSASNPVGLLEAGGTDRDNKDNITGSANLELKIIDGLKLKGVYGFDLYNDHDLIMPKKVAFYDSEESTSPSVYYNDDVSLTDNTSRNLLQNAQLYFDFDKTFRNAHHVSALLGVSTEKTKYSESNIYETYTDEDLGIAISNTQVSASSISTTPQTTDQTALNSIFGRLGYAYNDKYYGEFDFRYDGSSKFDKDNRWSFFPSLSLGWRVSDESFMNFYKNRVGDFKLRGSYGILGNQSVSNYQYQTSYSVYSGAYSFNNALVSGASMTLGNSNLKWESTATFNIGFDATFLKNALTVSFDYYNKNTTDILLTPTVAATYGGTVSAYNAGKMRNQGWEITLGYKLKTGDFHHNFSFNVSDSKNKVTKYDGDELIISGDADMQSIIRVGEALNSYYGYETDGYFKNTADVANSAKPTGYTSLQPGDVKYKDQNGDGVIDGKDRVILGNAFPRYTFGFTYGLNWKNFDFNMLIQGVGKRSIFLRGELIQPYHASYSFTMYQHQLDFWTPTNPDAEWPRLAASGSVSDQNNYGMSSSLHVLNGAYLRVKNIQLGYSLPKIFLSKLGINKVRVYANVQNALTFSKTKFVDPETTEYGSNMTLNGANSARNYPTLIYYGGGLDIEF
jgi:TonB-linked SusC/RagA family outer membrane protein